MKSKRKSAGKKHRLLYYKHTMDRLWRISFLLDIILWASWWFAGPRLGDFLDNFLNKGAIVVLGIAVFAFFARNMAYAQPKADHLLLVTPFLRLKISYRRIVSVRPVEFVQLYSPKNLSWADKRFAQPYFGKTVAAVILNGFPLRPAIMRLFFPKMIFHPLEKAGLLLVVPDWMAFSTDFDNFQGQFREGQGQRPKSLSMRGMYGDGE